MGWVALEAVELKLRVRLVEVGAMLRGPALLWERLRRGCTVVTDWARGPNAAVLALTTTTYPNEAEAVAALNAAEATQVQRGQRMLHAAAPSHDALARRPRTTPSHDALSERPLRTPYPSHNQRSQPQSQSAVTFSPSTPLHRSRHRSLVAPPTPQAELVLQTGTIDDELTPLAAALTQAATAIAPEYVPRAENAMASLAPVQAAVAPLAARLVALKAEVARQRRLAAERMLYAAGVAALRKSVSRAAELVQFPISSLDTPAVLSAALAAGKAHDDAISTPTEGGRLDSAVNDQAEALRAEWATLAHALSMRLAEKEGEMRSAVQAASMTEEVPAQSPHQQSASPRQQSPPPRQ